MFVGFLLQFHIFVWFAFKHVRNSRNQQQLKRAAFHTIAKRWNFRADLAPQIILLIHVVSCRLVCHCAETNIADIAPGNGWLEY